MHIEPFKTVESPESPIKRQMIYLYACLEPQRRYFTFTFRRKKKKKKESFSNNETLIRANILCHEITNKYSFSFFSWNNTFKKLWHCGIWHILVHIVKLKSFRNLGSVSANTKYWDFKFFLIFILGSPCLRIDCFLLNALFSILIKVKTPMY